MIAWIAPVQGTPIEAWRQRILASVLLGLAVLGLVAAVPGIVLAWRDGIPAVIVTNVMAYSLVIAVLLGRHWPYRVRATVVVALPALVGMFFLASFGFEGAGFPWLMAFPILGSVLLGIRSGVRCVLVTALILALFAWCIPTGAFAWANAMPQALSRWMISSINVVSLCALVGLPVGFMFDGLGNEATARAAAEQSAHRLTSAIEQSDGLVWLMEGAGALRYANSAARTLLGDRFDVTALVPWSSVRAGTPWAGELTVAGHDGVPVRLSGTMSPVRTGSTVTHVLLTLRDVRRERALESRLQQGQKLEAIGTLAGGIAHDFNNLLQPMLLNTEAALEQLPPGHALRPVMQDVRQSAERAGALVRRILTFTRSVNPERSVVDVAALLEETVRLLRLRIPTNVSLRTTATAGAHVVADPSELQQVMMNLTSNAAQAMPTGGALSLAVTVLATRRAARVSAEVSAESPAKVSAETPAEIPAEVHAAMPSAEEVVCLSVTDTGEGMDPSVLRRAFEPFYTTKSPGEGTGLGLAMVHGTITALGGVVVPQSEAGKGTTMRVYLPRVAGPVHAFEELPIGAASATQRQVLIVDDEPSVLAATARLMQRLGWKVERCTDPRLVVERLDALSSPVDCVLTDLSMPGMSGVQLAEQLRQRHPTIPIVLMTGYLEHDALPHAREHGINQVLVKPFSSAELARVMASAVANRATS